jgi:hypothetical protein
MLSLAPLDAFLRSGDVPHGTTVSSQELRIATDGKSGAAGAARRGISRMMLSCRSERTQVNCSAMLFGFGA